MSVPRGNRKWRFGAVRTAFDPIRTPVDDRLRSLCVAHNIGRKIERTPRAMAHVKTSRDIYYLLITLP
jgi:hypothetical protein